MIMRTVLAAALLASMAAADELLELEHGTGKRQLQIPEPEPGRGGSSPNGPPSPPHPPGSPPPPPLRSSDARGCAAEFGSSPTIGTVSAPAGAFVTPRAMAFNPIRPGELWVADSGRDAASVVELGQSASGAISVNAVKVIKDRAQYHYMDQVSSIAFDPIGQFATCQER